MNECVANVQTTLNEFEDSVYSLIDENCSSERYVRHGDRFTGRWYKAGDVYWRYKDSKAPVEDDHVSYPTPMVRYDQPDKSFVLIAGKIYGIERVVRPSCRTVYFRQSLEILKESNPQFYTVIQPFVSIITPALAGALAPRKAEYDAAATAVVKRDRPSPEQKAQTQHSMAEVDDLENSFHALSTNTAATAVVEYERPSLEQETQTELSMAGVDDLHNSLRALSITINHGFQSLRAIVSTQE